MILSMKLNSPANYNFEGIVMAQLSKFPFFDRHKYRKHKIHLCFTQIDPECTNYEVRNSDLRNRARFYLLKHLGRKSDAHKAYARAIGLTEDSAIREFLIHQQSTNLD
jgi:hypothetical protein